jgi:hypothetical protein
MLHLSHPPPAIHAREDRRDPPWLQEATQKRRQRDARFMAVTEAHRADERHRAAWRPELDKTHYRGPVRPLRT